MFIDRLRSELLGTPLGVPCPRCTLFDVAPLLRAFRPILFGVEFAKLP